MQGERFVPRRRVRDRIGECVGRSRGKSVLNVGLGGFVDDPEQTRRELGADLSGTLHGRLHGAARELTGLDINPLAIEYVSRTIPCRYHLDDITVDGMAGRIAQRFDVIILSEVMEHLDCCRGALSNLKAILNPGGEIIITTPNCFSFRAFLYILMGYEAVHLEHTAYFSYFTLKRLLAMNGLRLEFFGFYNEDLGERGGLIRRVTRLVSRVATTVLPQTSDGIFCVAAPIPSA